ncbi:MAG: hypothetical protein JWP81_2226 [Ferruginibacter sp.]|nr:hypothetical protein [Ferruginibacter sp.]
MKHFILTLLTFSLTAAKAQKIDQIFVNLYTDSLKKGTFNYINIDGQLTNGQYLPLDSTHLIFTASAGKFTGNCLWVDPNFKEDKVSIKVVLRDNPTLTKQFDMYIKKKPNDERLKTTDEILNELKAGKKSKNRGR